MRLSATSRLSLIADVGHERTRMKQPQFTKSEESLLWRMDWPNGWIAVGLLIFCVVGIPYEIFRGPGFWAKWAQWVIIVLVASDCLTLRTFKSILKKIEQANKDEKDVQPAP